MSNSTLTLSKTESGEVIVKKSRIRRFADGINTFLDFVFLTRSISPHQKKLKVIAGTVFGIGGLCLCPMVITYIMDKDWKKTILTSVVFVLATIHFFLFMLFVRWRKTFDTMFNIFLGFSTRFQIFPNSQPIFAIALLIVGYQTDLIALHIFSRTVINGGYLIASSTLIFASLFLGNIYVQIVIPTLHFLVVISLGFVEFFTTDLVREIFMHSEYYVGNSRNIMFQMYFNIFILCAVFVTLHFMNAFVRNKQFKKIEAISESIRELDLANSVCTNLLIKKAEDCTKLEKILKQIIVNIFEYKKYLPSYLYTGKEDESSSHPSEENVDHQASFTTRSSGSSGKETKKEICLHTKDCSFVLIDIYGTYEERTRNAKQNHYKTVFEKIEIHRTKCFGELYSVFGSFILISWNMNQIKVEHSDLAVQFAFKLNMELQSVLGLDYSIIVTSGIVGLGMLGYQTYKRFNICGQPISRLNDYSTQVRKLNISRTVFVDENVYEKTKFYIETKKISTIEGLYQLNEIKALENGKEWNYQLKEYLTEDK